MTERVEQVLAALPRGNSLDDAAWRRRHRMLLWFLAAHVPVLLVVGAATGRRLEDMLLELLPIGVALALGIVSRGRFARSAATTLGLVFSASVLVYFTGGLVEAHFHYFVLLGFVALYQDWRPYLLALAYVVLGHGLVGVVAPGAVYNQPLAVAHPWAWAIVHGGFVLAASAAQVMFWKQIERGQAQAHDYYARLYQGERAIVAQLRQAQTVKDQLISVVGHEFRTPLTAIQGFARTLDARSDRMGREAVQTCTQAIEREAKRMTRMVANVLAASTDLVPPPGARCDLAQVAATAVGQVVEINPVGARHVHVHIPDGPQVGLTAPHAEQLVYNLVDNAVKFAAAGSDVRVSARCEDGLAVLEVANVGPPIDEHDRERIFDAFVQADSSETRRYGGMGLGLPIARKILAAYGGAMGVYCDGPVVIARAWLPVAAPVPARRRPHRTSSLVG